MQHLAAGHPQLFAVPPPQLGPHPEHHVRGPLVAVLLVELEEAKGRFGLLVIVLLPIDAGPGPGFPQRVPVPLPHLGGAPRPRFELELSRRRPGVEKLLVGPGE
eukprot:11211766-Lingulodinium_polyedra.AAC.1